MNDLERKILRYERLYNEYENELLILIAEWIRDGIDGYELDSNINDWISERSRAKDDKKISEISKKYQSEIEWQLAGLIIALLEKEKQVHIKADYRDVQNPTEKVKDIEEKIDKVIPSVLDEVKIEQKQHFYDVHKTLIEEYGKEYKEILDTIAKEVTAGRKSITEATIDIIKEYSKRGLTALNRRDGARLSVDGYVSSSVRWLQKDIATKTENKLFDELGIDLVEITSLKDSRITHIPFQGKVYSRSGTSEKYPPLTSTGYGTITGLITGINCRHKMIPFYEELGQQYPEYDYEETVQNYKNSQKQRELERNIRKSEREYNLLKKAGVDNEEIARAKAKHETNLIKLKQFLNQTGRKRQKSREETEYSEQGRNTKSGKKTD